MSQLNCIISPSVLASDFSKLGAEVQRMKDSGAEWVHMDIMDGHFVPNLTMGPCVLESVHKSVPGVFMDCHMMVADPREWIPAVAKAGGQSYTFHYEALKSPAEAFDLIKIIKENNMLAAVAISPDTPSTVISEELGNAVDMILVMTVVPGKGGQKFMESCLPKVSQLRKRFPTKNIQVDGGVGPKTVDSCAEAGSNVLVAGTALFGAENPSEVMTTMRQAVDHHKASWKH